MKPYPEDPGFEDSSDTSEAAAETMIIPKAKMQWIVKQTIVTRPAGLTCDEVEAITGFRHQSASARIRELLLQGDIADSGYRRRNRSGRFGAVWIAATAPPPTNGTPALEPEPTLF